MVENGSVKSYFMLGKSPKLHWTKIICYQWGHALEVLAKNVNKWHLSSKQATQRSCQKSYRILTFFVCRCYKKKSCWEMIFVAPFITWRLLKIFLEIKKKSLYLLWWYLIFIWILSKCINFIFCDWEGKY